jgi:hypothetical protein
VSFSTEVTMPERQLIHQNWVDEESAAGGDLRRSPATALVEKDLPEVDVHLHVPEEPFRRCLRQESRYNIAGVCVAKIWKGHPATGEIMPRHGLPIGGLKEKFCV